MTIKKHGSQPSQSNPAASSFVFGYAPSPTPPNGPVRKKSIPLEEKNVLIKNLLQRASFSDSEIGELIEEKFGHAIEFLMESQTFRNLVKRYLQTDQAFSVA